MQPLQRGHAAGMPLLAGQALRSILPHLLPAEVPGSDRARHHDEAAAHDQALAGTAARRRCSRRRCLL